jgi:nicotinamidase-related amidase
MGKSTRVVSKSTRVVGKKYPIPAFFDPQKVGEVWRVPYEERAAQAKAWALQQKITPASEDRRKIALLLIDVQNTFCTENFELVVGGAVEDNRRLVRFIYENLGKITEIIPTLDTHKAAQIFHACFWVNAQGEHPPAMTPILLDEVLEGKWKVNPHLTLATQFHQGIQELQNYANHYVKKLTKDGKYPLMIWPYHALLGGLGHCLVSSVEEACFFHQMVRHCPTRFELKGENPLTENYSILQAEVLKDARGKANCQEKRCFTHASFRRM